MGHWFRTACFAILALFANLANAGDNTQNNDADLIWRCWYDQQTHITCLMEKVPESGNPLLQTIPANLPPLVVTLRTDPGALRNKIIHIPLHTEPYDMEFTAILAKASVCGSRRDCAVNFTDKLPPAEEIIALLNKHLPAAPGNARIVLAMLADVLDDF